MKGKFTKDRNGHYRAELEERLLANFLESDIQSSAEAVHEIEYEINHLQGQSWSRSGNVCHLELTREKVSIEYLWEDDEPALILPVGEFLDDIRKWHDFITQDESDEQMLEMKIY